MAQFTPQEANDIIRRYNDALASGTPVTAKLAKDMRDAAIGIKNYSDNLQQKTNDLKNATLNVAKKLSEGEEGLSVYSEAVEAGGDALGAWAQKFPLVGNAAKKVAEYSAKYFAASMKQGDEIFKNYQIMSRSGLVVGMDSTFKNLQAAGYTVSEIGEFSDLMKKNVTTLVTLGGTAAEGLKGFTEVTHALNSTDLMVGFSNMGMSVTDINEGTANYIKFQQLSGSTKIKTTKELTEGARDYIEQQDRLAKLTGLNAEKQNAAYERALRLEQFNQNQMVLQRKIDAGGAGSKEAQDEFNRNRDLMSMMTAAGAESQSDGLALILSNSVNDPRYKQFALAFPETVRKIQAGEKNAQVIQNSLGQEAKKVLSENQGTAQAGNFEKLFGPITGFMALASTTTKDYVADNAKAIADQQAQRAGEADPNTAKMAAIRNNQRSATQSADKFINQGIGPATAALAKISGLAQQAAGVAGQAAGKEGQIGGGTTLLDKTKEFFSFSKSSGSGNENARVLPNQSAAPVVAATTAATAPVVAATTATTATVPVVSSTAATAALPITIPGQQRQFNQPSVAENPKSEKNNGTQWFVNPFTIISAELSRAGMLQSNYTTASSRANKEQLVNQSLAQNDATRMLETTTSGQNSITALTNRLVLRGISPTQKSFEMLSDMLELQSTGVSGADSSGKMNGTSSLLNRSKALLNNMINSGAVSAGAAGGGSAGGAGGAGGGGGATGATGATGASAGGTSSSGNGATATTSTTDTAGGNAANAMKLNAGSSGGGIQGGSEATEQAGGLAAGTAPTTVGQNQQLLLDAMNELGVKDPKVRAAMAASAEGESGFKMQSEIGYENTSNANIRKSFGAGSVFGKMPDDELTKIKADPAKFFDYVYGGRYGNDQPGDGWKYRGRGFIGITFKGNYREYGKRLGIDLVGNPDLANDPKIAAKIAVMMMLDGMKKNPGADLYTQVARSIGNSNEVTEQRKKDAYARNMQTGEYGADKVADLSFMKRGADTQTASASAPIQTASAEIPAAPTAPKEEGGRKMQSAQLGGTLTGPTEGYQAMLHGTEAVVPLPDGKSIPLEMPEEDDGSEQLTALLSEKVQKLGLLVDSMTKHTNMSRQLLQLQG